MFLISIIRHTRGYVRFTVEGTYVERFLNLLARERISVWDMERQGNVLVACVAASAYPSMRALAKKAGVRLRLAEKKGVPFQRKKLKRQRGLVVGLALFALFLFVMSRFIWSIQVNGNGSVPEDVILSALEEIGIKPGIRASTIDVRDSERRALLALQDFSWVALNIDGSTLYVEVYETMPVPPIIDPESPCNVVASHSGQILEMRVYSGQPMLQQGDAVLEGQLLVSGITQDRREQNLFRHARADIIAQVELELEVGIPLQQVEYRETGSTRSRNYLRVFGFEMPLFLPRQIPRPYMAQRTEHPLVLFSAELPVSRRKELFILMEEIPVTYTEQQAKELAMRELAALERVEMAEGDIIERTLTARIEEEQYILSAQYICHMNIAQQKEILRSE